MTIKIGKSALVGALLLVILAAVYNVVFFVLPWRIPESNGAFWVTYGFTWGAILFAGIVSAIAFGKKELKSKIFGIPVFYVGLGLLIFQILVDGMVLSIGSFYKIRFWFVLIPEVFVFGLAAIMTIVRASYRDFIDSVDAKYVNKKEFIQELRIEAAALVKQNKVEELRHNLEKFLETIKYADPVSSNTVIEVEDQIVDKFEKLKKTVNEKDTNKSESLIDELLSLLEERKSRLKDSRKN